MKALTFYLSLLILAGVNYEANAQYSRSNFDGSGYAATANARNSNDYFNNPNRNATRAERLRFQNDLVRRADRLDDIERNLRFRQAALEGRRLRNNRGLARSNRPPGLLNNRELRSWDVRLTRKANRLRSFERDILRAERRRGNNNRGIRRGGRNNGNTRGGGNNGGTYCPPGWG